MSVLRYQLSTEKIVGLIDRQNTITYVVNHDATKSEIKSDFEKRFNVKVSRVNTVEMPKNFKKAFIKLAPNYKAGDVAVKLKLV